MPNTLSRVKTTCPMKTTVDFFPNADRITIDGSIKVRKFVAARAPSQNRF